MHRGEFFGVATVGERGQIVIPIEARKAYNIEIGDKLMVFGRRYAGGLLLVQADVFLNHVQETMTELTDLGRLLEDLRGKGMIERDSTAGPALEPEAKPSPALGNDSVSQGKDGSGGPVGEKGRRRDR